MKTVLVTGSTRGIGQAIARHFKSQGWYVIGSGTKPMDVPEYLDQYFNCDLSQDQELENFVKQVNNLEVDTLINNAGININDEFLNIKKQDFEKIQTVNVYAPFRLSQGVLPYMLKNNWGRIVNISSVWGKISKAGRGSYSASKFGIDGLTLAMANEFAQQGILCNCIAPGFIDTEMTWRNLGISGVEKMLELVPIRRLAKVEEVANLAYILGSENNTYISGQNIAIDGGFTRA